MPVLSPAAMARVRVVVLQRDEPAVLRALGRLGVLELVSGPPDPAQATRPAPDRSGEMARWANVQARADRLGTVLGLARQPALDPGEPADLALSAAEDLVARIEAQVDPLVQRRGALRRDMQEAGSRMEWARGHRALAWPGGLDPGWMFLRVTWGQVPVSAWERLAEGLKADAVVVRVGGTSERATVLVAMKRSRSEAVEAVLREAGFEREDAPADWVRDADSAALESSATEDQRRLAEALEHLDQEQAVAAERFRDDLIQLERRAAMELHLLKARALLQRTDLTVVIQGWMAEADLEAADKAVADGTGGRYALGITRVDARSEGEVPTLLRSPRWLRAFAGLVTAYGFPAYREVVPTLFVALSYPLMIGMMFGDVGHGGVMALAGGLLLAKARGVEGRQAGVLLAVAGLASMMFGWVYGSCFGLHAFRQHALWADPLEADPAVLMRAAIGAGMAMISVGLVLHVVNRLRRGDWCGALLDRFGLAGLVFYWGAIGWLVLPGDGREGMPAGWAWVIVGTAVLAWVLKAPVDHLVRRWRARSSPGEEGLGVALTESLVGSFEGVLLYLANTISFVRLAAYALSHAALLMATAGLADQARQVPVLGIPGAWAVFLAGNAVTMVLEGIVACVQALRLEYYEFFGKFFAGDGRPFAPFRLTPEPGG